MKLSFKALLLTATLALSMTAMAQDNLTDEQLSEKYKQEIAIKKAELKTVKAKMKANPTNTDLAVEKVGIENALADLKSKKKVIDTNIKAQKKQKKAEKAAQKAKEAAEKAAQEAEALRKAQQQ